MQPRLACYSNRFDCAQHGSAALSVSKMTSPLASLATKTLNKRERQMGHESDEIPSTKPTLIYTEIILISHARFFRKVSGQLDLRQVPRHKPIDDASTNDKSRTGKAWKNQ